MIEIIIAFFVSYQYEKEKEVHRDVLSISPILLLTLFLLPMIIISQDLDDYKWKNRLVFIVGDSLDTSAVQEQLKLFQENKEAMADRDLVLFLANSTKVVDLEQNPSSISVAELQEAAHIGSHFEGVILLGKDGGYKLKKKFQVEPKEIFDLIDGMPMRQFEMKSKL